MGIVVVVGGVLSGDEVKERSCVNGLCGGGVPMMAPETTITSLSTWLRYTAHPSRPKVRSQDMVGDVEPE